MGPQWPLETPYLSSNLFKTLKKKVDVKKTDLVAFLLRYKVHMRQLENSDMIDKNGDYAEFVAVLEHVAKGWERRLPIQHV